MDNLTLAEDKNIAAIIRIITEHIRPSCIILFGSRARGTAHRYSDYDVAIAGADMDHRTERRLKEALDEGLGIFTVDLTNLDRAEPEFKEIVMQDGVIVYED